MAFYEADPDHRLINSEMKLFIDDCATRKLAIGRLNNNKIIES